MRRCRSAVRQDRYALSLTNKHQAAWWCPSTELPEHLPYQSLIYLSRRLLIVTTASSAPSTRAATPVLASA